MPVAIELSAQDQEQYRRAHRWSAAIKAGLLAGAIILMVPAGNPWTSLAGPSGAYIMGRPVSSEQSITMFSAEAIQVAIAHLAVSVVYALVLLPAAYRLRSWRALLAGVIGALVLYALNFAVFRAFAPQFTGAYEFNAALAHVLFGGLTAGMIRGFLRPPQELDSTQPNPGPRKP